MIQDQTVVDNEARRPGFTKIFEEIRKENPRMDFNLAMHKAKERWHELNPASK